MNGSVLLTLALPMLWLVGGASAQPASCPASPHAVGNLQFLGSTEAKRVTGTLSAAFGGISGIDFDAATGDWYLLSDDKSEHAPARAYKARIAVGANGFDAFELGQIIPLPVVTNERPDPESIRVAPCVGLLAWASEGDERDGVSPSVRLMTRGGQAAAEVAIPVNLRLPNARDNLSFEGLAYSPGGQFLWLSMEAPLVADGDVPDLEHGALVRFSKLPAAGGRSAQYAYPVEAIPLAATGGTLRANNGVSEILSTVENCLLVIERSGREVSAGNFAFQVRLYEACVGAATEISSIASLKDQSVVPMRKRLVLDLAALQLPHLDNIEAAAWGPRLPDGRATLVLASDDNFSPHQTNQFLVFAVDAP